MHTTAEPGGFDHFLGGERKLCAMESLVYVSILSIIASGGAIQALYLAYWGGAYLSESNETFLV